MKNLLFTLDYELFGNGSGDVFKHIIEPTNRLLGLAAKYGMKFTFFFEVIEYWRLKEEWKKGNTMGYQTNPIDAMENQIREAYRQGHDVQLHLHPQWVDARWNNGKWEVSVGQWRLGGYDGTGKNSLENLVKRGKQTLEDLLRPVNPKYECLALRAGGYNIQPSEEIVKAMDDAGILIDSSIYPGGKETGQLSNYDYTSISPTKGVWHIGKELEKEGRSNIVELPIVAFPMIRLKKFMTWERVKGILRNKQSAMDSFEARVSTIGNKSGIWDKVKYFFTIEWQTWDYCLFSRSLHKEFIKRVSAQERDIFVLVGHPKSFTGARGLDYLLKKTHRTFDYKTISDVWDIVK